MTPDFENILKEEFQKKFPNEDYNDTLTDDAINFLFKNCMLRAHNAAIEAAAEAAKTGLSTYNPAIAGYTVVVDKESILKLKLPGV